MPTNLELKARCDTHGPLFKVLIGLKARNIGLVVQTDTYFHFHPGRLKMRETRNSGSELIWYQRPNTLNDRYSDFKRVPVKDSRSLKRILSAGIGVKAIVRKKRRVYLFKNARIHLDTVDRLGSFIEFEVKVAKGRSQAERLLSFLRKSFNIKSQTVLVTSYGDLIRRSRKNTS